jgi:enoyl-CoA hydratase
VSALPTYKYLQIDIAERIATVALNRPPVNAVNAEMYGEIRDLFSSFNEILPDISVVILTGTGKHFCAGNDLEDFGTMTPLNAPNRMRLVREAFWSIYDCPVPTIAAVRGVGLGTGLALAASCDMIVCGESAKLGTPEVGVGVMGGAKHLARLLPQPLVRLLYFTAEPMGAADLLKYGAVIDVVPDEELPSAAADLAGRIAKHSAVALREAKGALNVIEPMDLKTGYEYEQHHTGTMSGTSDAKEALRSIQERRPPVYGHDWNPAR